MAKKQSESIAEQLREKRESVKSLLAKTPPTADDAASIKTLIEEIKALDEDFANQTAIENFEATNEEALKKLNTPQRPQFLGMTPAGDTFIETQTDPATKQSQLRVDSETGFLGLSEQQAVAIAQPEYKTAFREYLRTPYGALDMKHMKILQEGVDSQGGYLVPEQYLNKMIEKLAAPSRLAGLVNRLTTSRDNLNIPRVVYNDDNIYTTGMRVTWTGEIPASPTVHRVVDPVFGMIRIPVHTAMMSLPMTNDMVEDAAFPVLAWATGKFQETIELLYEHMILAGTGTGQPSGILKAPGTVDNPPTSPLGTGTAITADNIIAITYDVPSQYDGNSRFVLNKTSTGKAIALLKDTTNRYLFAAGIPNADGIALDRPNTLVGYPFVYSPFMPNAAALAYPLIFGDLTGYTLVQRIGLSIQVLRERYAEENQIVLLGRIRFGGAITEPWKLRIGVMA